MHIAISRNIYGIGTQLMLDIPVHHKFLLLGAFVGAMLLLDLRNPPRKRQRWQSYSFLLGVGIAGAILGIANDLITSSLSSDYFIYFKGIEPDRQFLKNVLTLGTQAGFSGAAVGGGILLLCKPKSKPIQALLPIVKWPFISAIAGGIIFGTLSHLLHWPQTFGDLDGLLTSAQAHRFHTVWLIHIGLYVGALVGLMVISIRLCTTSKMN
ncbi:MAG: hypothetical protein VKL39_04545 [Leptolyngbyaceae bacterium]|nr:hypothetical protein [Leptolyngbyaceae bacterium]